MDEEVRCRAASVYRDDMQCIELVAAFYDRPREGFVPMLLGENDGWKIVARDVEGLLKHASPSDVVIFMPISTELHLFHIGLYTGNGYCLSKMGEESGLYELPLNEYILSYHSLTVLLCRRT